MSQYVECQTEIRNLAALCRALQEMGWAVDEIEVHDHPAALYGYRSDERPEHAEVIIRRQYVGEMSNDIGFRRQADGCYAAIVSEYDQRQRGRHGPYDQAWLGRLTQAYAAHLITAQYQQKGLRVTRTQREDGVVRLLVQR